MTTLFLHNDPTLESSWRSIVLLGVNVASYKFALAKSILDLAAKETTLIRLEDLAVPFSKHICDHLKICDKQITSSKSTFLQACRDFNAGTVSQDELIHKTVKLGFNNVIDAFHIVSHGPVPFKFFEDRRTDDQKSIVITDDLLRLKESKHFINLPHEVEARWRLVETSWNLNLSRRCLEVFYDGYEDLYVKPALERQNITSCRKALNGYQKGKCFYCNRHISVRPGDHELADIDHFFPHLLKKFMPSTNFDGVWNLVLSCPDCNRGENGKFERLPNIIFLEKLHRRNNYFIESHHPLRETLMLQTGKLEKHRTDYLRQMDNKAIQLLIHRWTPRDTDLAL